MSTRKLVEVTAKDFEVKYDAERTFPFYEDENATGVYGYGHTDKDEFAASVTEFDRYANGEFWHPDEVYTADDVHHGWAVAYDSTAFGGEWAWDRSGVSFDTPGAFPMTWIYR